MNIQHHPQHTTQINEFIVKCYMNTIYFPWIYSWILNENERSKSVNLCSQALQWAHDISFIMTIFITELFWFMIIGITRQQKMMTRNERLNNFFLMEIWSIISVLVEFFCRSLSHSTNEQMNWDIPKRERERERELTTAKDRSKI